MPGKRRPKTGDTPVFSTADTRVMNKQSTHSTVSRELAIDRKEPLISRQRRELHDAIDQLYLGTPLDETQMAQLDELESVEQAVSRARRQLHEQIDELRAQIGPEPARPLGWQVVARGGFQPPARGSNPVGLAGRAGA